MAFKDYVNYNTIKVVKINSWSLGFIHYAIQFAIIMYITIHVLIMKKGYQGEGPAIGSTSLKVKGQGLVGTDVWDPIDVVYPANENEALFLTTNFWQTQKQNRTVCPEISQEFKCSSNVNCTEGKVTTNGVEDGVCDPGSKTCEIYSWCPIEQEPKNHTDNIIQGVGDFTIFIRSVARFPKYDIVRNNANGTKPTRGFNLFSLKDLIQLMAEDDNSTTSIETLANRGAIIAVIINWDCNFDHPREDCLPDYDIERVDDPSSLLSGGYNFRYGTYHPDGTRTLTKVYGIRLLFMMRGVGKKFDPVVTILTIGSGMALLGVAKVVADFIAIYLLPEKNAIRKAKYNEISKEEIYGDLSDSEQDAASKEPLLGKP